jgi:hypothetical protein
LIQLDARWLATPSRQTAWPMPASLQHYQTLHLTFAALNPRTDSLLPLRWINCEGENYFTDINVTLPGFSKADYACSIEPAVWSAIRPPVTDAWLDDAYLLVGEPVLRRSTRIRAVAIVPGEPE